MMRSMAGKKIVGLILCAVVSFAVYGNGQTESSGAGSQKPEFVLKAGGSGPIGTYFDAFYLGFGKEVEAKSNGRIKVDFYPSNTLGGERELMEMVQQGLADVNMSSNSVYSLFDPNWAILDIPYLFPTREEMYGFLDSPASQKLKDGMLAKGVRILAIGENTVRQVSNKKHEVVTVDDLKGLKIRVTETPAMVDWLKSVGADPTVLPLPELYTALQQSVVDGQDNGMSNGYLVKFHEVQKYWTDTNHQINVMPIGISEKTWQKLPPDLQAVVAEAAVNAGKAGRQASIDFEKAVIPTLEAAGIKVTLLTDDQRTTFIKSAEPIVKKYGAKIDPELWSAVMKFLGRN